MSPSSSDVGTIRRGPRFASATPRSTASRHSEPPLEIPLNGQVVTFSSRTPRGAAVARQPYARPEATRYRVVADGRKRIARQFASLRLHLIRCLSLFSRMDLKAARRNAPRRESAGCSRPARLSVARAVNAVPAARPTDRLRLTIRGTPRSRASQTSPRRSRKRVSRAKANAASWLFSKARSARSRHAPTHCRVGSGAGFAFSAPIAFSRSKIATCSRGSPGRRWSGSRASRTSPRGSARARRSCAACWAMEPREQPRARERKPGRDLHVPSTISARSSPRWQRHSGPWQLQRGCRGRSAHSIAYRALHKRWTAGLRRRTAAGAGAIALQAFRSVD